MGQLPRGYPTRAGIVVWQAWLACKSTREIAEQEQLALDTVEKQLTVLKSERFPDLVQSPPASLQLYDVWQFNKAADEYGVARLPHTRGETDAKEERFPELHEFTPHARGTDRIVSTSRR